MRQHTLRITASAAVFAAALACWPGVRAATAAPRSRRRSAYNALPQKALADSLSALGMTELMSELMKSGAATGAGDVRVTAAEALIKAAKGAKDPAEREAKLDEAIRILRAAVKALEAQADAADTPLKGARATIKKMQNELLMAVTQALTRGEPYANKLLFLQGAAADRAALAAATQGAARTVRDLGADIEDLKLDWRRDMRIWIVVSKTVRGLEDEIKYRAAWIRFYHGMAAKNTKAGRSDLRAVEPSVELFTDGSRGQDVKQQSELLIARSFRELERHEPAAQMLGRIISGRGPGRIRVDAHFEQVRNLIEFGRTLAKAGKGGDAKYNQVPAALKTFELEAKKLAADEQSKRSIDLWAALLGHYFWETRAGTEKDKAKAAAFGNKAQEALLGFLEKYPDEGIQQAFYEIIYRKYRDRKDYDKLSSAVLMAIASHEYNEARRDKSNKTALATAKAVLVKVSKRTDKVSKRVRPLVLWQLAFIFNFERDNFRSSRFFVQLATEFPDHKLAYTAARYANATMAAHYKGTPLSRIPENGLDLLELVLKTLTTGQKWKDNKDVLRWNFQYAELLALRKGKAEQARVKNAKAEAHNANLDAREAEQFARDLKDPKARADAHNRAKELRAKADELKTRAEEVIRDAREVFRKIAQIYERVPDKPHMAHMQARQRGLRYRKFVLDMHPDQAAGSQRKEEALALAELLLKYSGDVRAALESEKDPRAVADLKIWGSEAMVMAIELLLDHGGDSESARAMRLLDGMAEAWPGTPALQYSEDLRIRKLVELGRIDDAISALDKFIKKHPAQGDELLKMVITSLQDRIDRDQGSTKPDIQQRWEKYVKNYVSLAGKLFQRVEAQPLNQRYAITQSYADALIKAGRYAEALEMFLKCQEYDKENSRKQQQKIVDEFKPMHAKVAAAKTYDDLAACRSQLTAVLKQHEVDPAEERLVKLEGALVEVDLALSMLKDMSPDARQASAGQEHVANGRKWLAEAFKLLEERLKGGVKVQAMNVLGLARAYKGRADGYRKEGKLKEMKADYDQALKYFRNILSAGLTMSIKAQARMKWLAEVGYCECVLAAMSQNRQAVQAVLRRIRINEHSDSMMGGYRDRFMTIRANAERVLAN